MKINPFKFDMVPYTRGVGVELSSSDEVIFPHFIKIAEEEIRIFRPLSMDFVVFCTEEMSGKEIGKLFKVMWLLVKPNGYMNFVCLSDADISCVRKTKGWEQQEMRSSGSHLYISLKKLTGTHQKVKRPIEGKTCAVLRYGGIGDMMITACIFPELKKLGYHVTLYTHVNSYETVKHDPNIDRFVLQDSGQVPGEIFRDFVLSLSSKYDKVINLSESIEGTLLSLPDRVSYYWPKEVRHEMMNKCNYEITAGIAGVPLNLSGRFYPTERESQHAYKLDSKMSKPVIVWVMSGSSTHKVYPYQDQVIARLLLRYPKVTIVMVGDETCKLLQQGWENESRVILTAGKWSVREVMTFCYRANVIVTPETGVALGVQFADIPKVLLLSHSSPKNYADKWVDCTPLYDETCKCWPCHQMHYGYEYCSIDEETHCAMCQVGIDPDRVVDAIVNAIKGDK